MLSFEEELQKQLGLAGYPVTQKRGPASASTKKYYKYHEGTDIGTPTGTPIIPQFQGVYKGSINDQTGYGTRAEIYNPQTDATYYLSHLLALAGLQPGQTFNPGTTIGYTGGQPGSPGAGQTTGAHLDVVEKGGQQANLYNFASTLANAMRNPADIINRIKQQYGRSALAVSNNPQVLAELAKKYKGKTKITKITI